MTRRLDRWLRRRLPSLRNRLLAALLVPLALVMLATLPLDFRLAAGPARQAYDELLATEAQALADQVRWEQGRPVLTLNVQAEHLLRANGGDAEYFVVRDAEGRRLAGDVRLLPPVDAPGARPLFSDVRVRLYDGTEQDLRMVAVQRGQGAARVVVLVAETLNKRRAADRRVLAAMVLPNLLVAVLGVGLVYLATRLSLRPLDQLAQQVSERSPDDLRAIRLSDLPRELGPVVGSLDRLFSRVQAAAQRQQRFHANVAHQLRTPLAGLRAQLELAQQDGLFDRDAARHARIMSAIDRLVHLIDQLLVLARAEAGAVQVLQRQPLDVRQLIEDQASRLVDRALQGGMDLGFQLGPTPPVAGLPDLVGELLGNLVDNAIRHCPRGTHVTVLCGQAQGLPWLAVEDDGPGIAPERHALIFERFHRGTTAQAEGSGLGLAIVQEIAQLHGARIVATAGAQGRGSRFEVRWQA